jgi:hypothetical protein
MRYFALLHYFQPSPLFFGKKKFIDYVYKQCNIVYLAIDTRRLSGVEWMLIVLKNQTEIIEKCIRRTNEERKHRKRRPR